MSRDLRLYWDDILESARRIVRYTFGYDAALFKADERTRDAVLRNLEIIGEAAKRLPDGERATKPTIDWRRIAGFRDIIAHAYFGIDDAILWNIVSVKVPELLVTLGDGQRAAKRHLVCICSDRYGGVYSGGRWWALADSGRPSGKASRLKLLTEEDDGPDGSDTDAMVFWQAPPNWVGVGDSPSAAAAALDSGRFGELADNAELGYSSDQVSIIEDVFNGEHSGHSWLAFLEDRSRDRVLAHGFELSRHEADLFWSRPPNWAASGLSPNAALLALMDKQKDE